MIYLGNMSQIYVKENYLCNSYVDNHSLYDNVYSKNSDSERGLRIDMAILNKEMVQSKQ